MLRLIRRADGLWEETHAEVGCKFVHITEYDRAVGILREDLQKEYELSALKSLRIDELERGLEVSEEVSAKLGEELEEAEKPNGTMGSHYYEWMS